MKYLVVTTRHSSDFGERFCVFWGNREDPSGYTSNVRLAHRFSQKELPMAQLKNVGDFAVPCSALGVSEEYLPGSELTTEVVELVRVLEILRDLH